MAKTDTINALDLLTDQHTYVDSLFERVEEGDDADRMAAFVELADCIAAHSTIEEKIFYPRVMSENTRELLQESVEEHLSVKRVLADLLTMKLDNEEFDAKISVLKELISHHAHEEEEDKLFPIVRKQMDPDELAGLGNDLLAMFEELLKSAPRKQVPRETAQAAPLPA
jgi:hemerythrin superfamily protein